MPPPSFVHRPSYTDVSILINPPFVKAVTPLRWLLVLDDFRLAVMSMIVERLHGFAPVLF